MPIRVGIAGYRGYSGAELVRILASHRHFEPVLLEHRSDNAGRPAPMGARLPDRIACSAEAATAKGLAAALLATPPEVSMELAPAFLSAGLKVVDLSGAFRLGTAADYKRWYKEDHAAPELLTSAVYGLTEFQSDKVKTARLVANPGCYPTAANLAIQPLIAADLIDRSAGIVCDAKSGVSGAGRKPSLKTHFCEVTENFSAYSILDHRHVPEVLMNSGLEEAEFSFVAQLLPIHRGILETIYFRAKTDSAAEIVETYLQRYAGWASVRVYDAGVVPDIASVARTNYCDIGVRVDPATRRAVVVSAIDNLGKGAAGQAVQNLNLLFGLDHFEGLAA
jgi:N-acetyl-gamma-glutamyl-phosphate reductase